MISYGLFQKKSAWKMYAKAQNVDFEISNFISAQIDKYQTALKHADDENDVNVYDFIDEEYHELYDASEKYQGIVSSKSIHPCAYLIYDKDIREEIGVIKVKSDTSKKEVMVCLMDGSAAEKFKYLKNDILKVDVVLFFYKIAEKIKQPIPTEYELRKLCDGNEKVWDIYKNGMTLGVNQVEKEGTRLKAMRYKPRNIAETCAFVAGIRPSFQTMYKTFENREKFEYGIRTFDKIIQDTGLDSSFMLYQETIMAVLSYAGFPDDMTYDIIKAISKQDAFDYCQSNGLGYLHISDEVCSEYQSTKGRYFNEKIDYYQIQFN
jgi:DNA polymerase III alpha subunit